MSQINLNNKVVGMLLAVSSMVSLSPSVLAVGEMEIIDRIRPIGKVKISADRDVALVETLTEEAAAAESDATVKEAKEAVIEAVDQAAEATKEAVEKVAEAAGDVMVVANETAEVVTETATEVAEKVEQAAAEVVEKIEAAVPAEATPVADVSGLQTFNKACFACHGTGIPGIPKVGDKAAWAPRIEQGKPVLVEHVIKGFNAMPPRGGNADLSDAEIESAVGYLIAQGS